MNSDQNKIRGIQLFLWLYIYSIKTHTSKLAISRLSLHISWRSSHFCSVRAEAWVYGGGGGGGYIDRIWIPINQGIIQDAEGFHPPNYEPFYPSNILTSPSFITAQNITYLVVFLFFISIASEPQDIALKSGFNINFIV